MAIAQTNNQKFSRRNGNDPKAIASRAAKDELRTAQDAAETFASAVKSSANHLGARIGHAVSEKMFQVTAQAKGVQHKVQDSVRYRPLVAIGAAAGAGFLLAILCRR